MGKSNHHRKDKKKEKKAKNKYSDVVDDQDMPKVGDNHHGGENINSNNNHDHGTTVHVSDKVQRSRAKRQMHESDYSSGTTQSEDEFDRLFGKYQGPNHRRVEMEDKQGDELRHRVRPRRRRRSTEKATFRENERPLNRRRAAAMKPVRYRERDEDDLEPEKELSVVVVTKSNQKSQNLVVSSSDHVDGTDQTTSVKLKCKELSHDKSEVPHRDSKEGTITNPTINSTKRDDSLKQDTEGEIGQLETQARKRAKTSHEPPNPMKDCREESQHHEDKIKAKKSPQEDQGSFETPATQDKQIRQETLNDNPNPSQHFPALKQDTIALDIDMEPRLRHRKVEMQYLHKGRRVRLKIFDSVESASSKTGFTVRTLDAVCSEGGGLVGGSWFSFAETSATGGNHDDNHQQGERSSSQLKPKDFFYGSFFDVSTLMPLQVTDGSSQWWKRVIELLCKKTKRALVCFPSVECAATALGLSTKQVVLACHTYTTDEQYDFGSYVLRFKMKSSAYQYGSDEADFRKVVETHEERLARWKKLRIAQSSKRSEDENAKMPLPSTNNADDKEAASKSKDNTETKPFPKLPSTPHERLQKATSDLFKDGDPPLCMYSNLILNYPNRNSKSDDEGCHGVDSKQSSGDNKHDYVVVPFVSDETIQRLCMICQDVPAEIMFEPCGHCVICDNCIVHFRQSFCPQCRMGIRSQKLSTSLFRGVKLDLALKPQVFSAYSFMECE